MIKLEHKKLLDAGVHFGHLTKKWCPSMAPFIFMKRDGIHIIDLHKTSEHLYAAAMQLNVMASSGKKILFVATQKQAKGCVAEIAKGLGMPYMTERWLGGTLTNFATIRKLLKKISSIDKMTQSAAYKSLAKKEKLMITREQEKLNRILQGIVTITRLPAALFIVDINREHIAVKEAQKLGIPIFGITDTNTNPDLIDYPIPGNDDALRSVEVVMRYIGDAIKQGLDVYKKEALANAPTDSVNPQQGNEKKRTEQQTTTNDGTAKKTGIVGKRELIAHAKGAKVTQIDSSSSAKKSVADKAIALKDEKKSNAPTAKAISSKKGAANKSASPKVTTDKKVKSTDAKVVEPAKEDKK